MLPLSSPTDYLIVTTAVVGGNLVASMTTLTGFQLWLMWFIATQIIAVFMAVCSSLFVPPD